MTIAQESSTGRWTNYRYARECVSNSFYDVISAFPLQQLAAQSYVWDLARAADQTAVARQSSTKSADVHANAQRFVSALGGPDKCDVTESENGTIYVEWDTEDAFVSVEVGRSRFSLSRIPSTGTPTGEVGRVSDLDAIEALVAKHS